MTLTLLEFVASAKDKIVKENYLKKHLIAQNPYMKHTNMCLWNYTKQ
jgi:hypothetical protein